MPDRTLVEAVALELEPVIAEFDQQVPLQLPRRLVGDAAAAKVRMHGEPAEIGDAMQVASLLEPHHTGALAVHLDDQTAVPLRLAFGTLDLGPNALVIECAAAAEERLRVVIRQQLDQPVDVVRPRAP